MYMYIPEQNFYVIFLCRYEYFDFHHECRKMRWDRLSVLTDRLAEDINKFGYDSSSYVRHIAYRLTNHWSVSIALHPFICHNYIVDTLIPLKPMH